jgi:hypothetical protein
MGGGGDNKSRHTCEKESYKIKQKKKAGKITLGEILKHDKESERWGSTLL